MKILHAEEKSMWNDIKSIKLTHIIIRLFYAILIAATISAPYLINLFYVFPNGSRKTANIILCAFYLAVPAGLTALICLDKLLINIKKELAFHSGNVKLLRILSWACFYVAIDCFAFGFFYFPFFIVCVAALFTGLVVRVVKNIFAKAITIKEENELTI